MTRAIIVRHIYATATLVDSSEVWRKNVQVGKRRVRRTNGQERKTAFMKRCGHAAHVDFDGQASPAHKLHNRLDFFRGGRHGDLAAELHMPTGPTAIFASLRNGKTTTRNLCRKEDFK